MKTKTLPKGIVACALAALLSSTTSVAVTHTATAEQADETEPVAVVDEANMGAQSTIAPVSIDNVNDYRPYIADACRTSYVRNDRAGNLERIQWTGSKLVRETLDDAYGVTKRFTYPASTYRPSTIVDEELFCWGGFFSGQAHDYVVCGQKNPQKSDDTIVVRVTKYDKTGRFKGACEFKDGQENVPEDMRSFMRGWGSADVFNQSSVAFAEVGSDLHIRSSHLFYNGHQASMHLVIDTNTMRVVDSMTYSLSAHASTLGYASHSFAQRLTTLDKNVFATDLSDANPRAVTIKRCGTTEHFASLLPIRGADGVNQTGVTLGGMESSATRKTVLVNGVTIDQSLPTITIFSTEPRDVFVAVSTDAPKLAHIEYLTSYDKNGDKGAGFPKMVKLSENCFCVMWAETRAGNTMSYDETDQTGTVMWCIVDGNGKPTSDVKRMSGYLSDCDPVLHDGKVVWYAQRLPHDKAPVYYEIDPGETDTPEAYVFCDVTPNMAHYEDVVWVGANRISEGFAATGGKRAFKPFEATTRAQTAEFLFNLAQHWGVIDANWQPTTAQKRAFVDVSDSTPYARAIRWLASTGISTGWKLSGGKAEFRPDAQVARCDMAAFLFRMATLYGKASATWAPTTAQKKAFTDVDSKTPHAREVYWCAATGISKGWALGGGKAEFRPYAPILRIDYAAFVHRLDNV